MQDDEAIERLASAFYGAFDNREGRSPQTAALYAMFAPGATITRVSGGQADVMDVRSFIEPRAELLTSGRLVDFWEWEVEGETTIMGNIAARCSTYKKEGLLDGQPYAGGGRKVAQLWKREGEWLISSLLWEDDAA